MSVDPNIDYQSHDPEDRDEHSDDPRIQEALALEKRMREALATKENPLRDGESTSSRLKAGKNRDDAAPQEPSGE